MSSTMAASPKLPPGSPSTTASSSQSTPMPGGPSLASTPGAMSLREASSEGGEHNNKQRRSAKRSLFASSSSSSSAAAGGSLDERRSKLMASEQFGGVEERFSVLSDGGDDDTRVTKPVPVAGETWEEGMRSRAAERRTEMASLLGDMEGDVREMREVAALLKAVKVDSVDIRSILIAAAKTVSNINRDGKSPSKRHNPPSATTTTTPSRAPPPTPSAPSPSRRPPLHAPSPSPSKKKSAPSSGLRRQASPTGKSASPGRRSASPTKRRKEAASPGRPGSARRRAIASSASPRKVVHYVDGESWSKSPVKPTIDPNSIQFSSSASSYGVNPPQPPSPSHPSRALPPKPAAAAATTSSSPSLFKMGGKSISGMASTSPGYGVQDITARARALALATLPAPFESAGKSEEAHPERGSAATLVERLTTFYGKYNKSHVGLAPEIAQRYAGREAELSTLLRSKYGQNLPVARKEVAVDGGLDKEQRQAMARDRQCLLYAHTFGGSDAALSSMHQTSSKYHSLAMHPLPPPEPSFGTPPRVEKRGGGYFGDDSARFSPSVARPHSAPHKGRPGPAPGGDDDAGFTISEVMAWGPSQVRDFVSGFDRGLSGAAGKLARVGTDGAKLLGMNSSALQVECGLCSATERLLVMRSVEGLKVRIGFNDV